MDKLIIPKRIVLGVSSSIAIYKACELVRKLIHSGHNVSVVMTKNATELIQPRLFEELSGNPVYSDMWSFKKQLGVEHIELAKRDLFILAPATARIIGDVANGICSDMLSTAVIATKAPVIVCPAMNDNMYTHPAVQANINRLREWGYHIVEPVEGNLACGYIAKGKLAPTKDIIDVALNVIDKM